MKEQHHLLRGEFSKIMEVIQSMVESQYLANLLDVQEEVDKHNTCLWALNS